MKNFWGSVNKTEACWIWTGGRAGPYGASHVAGKSAGAHRVSWFLHTGVWPGKHDVLHTCPGGDNKLCVNPAHLRLGTKADNGRDRAERGQSARGAENGRARLNEDEVRVIRAMLAASETQSECARLFGITQAAVSSIASCKTWKHVK